MENINLINIILATTNDTMVTTRYVSPIAALIPILNPLPNSELINCRQCITRLATTGQANAGKYISRIHQVSRLN